jgi:hypothetical protein
VLHIQELEYYHRFDLKYFLLLVGSECMVSSTNEELGFITYLPDTLNLEHYRTLNRPVEWKPDRTSKPNMEWIEIVWKFFTSVEMTG